VTFRLSPVPDEWRLLAVVAHPDDLGYGAASAIAYWTPAGTCAHGVALGRVQLAGVR
jgi:LmbE family N-acetylglucosaminyl deacetylase